MNYFPAISSILSTASLAQFVIEKYGFSESTTCTILRVGINHTYLIEDIPNKYVLRVYYLNWRSEAEITAELVLLDLLKASGILVSYPIKDKSASYIQSINALEGERFAVLFSYAPGESVRNLSEKVCYHLGLEMAKMHQITIDQKINRKTYDAHTLVDWAFQTAAKRFAASSEEMQYIKRANAKIAAQFNKADASQLRFGAVHLDIWHDNMKISNESEITFFDFDNCGNSWLFLDIAYSIMLLFKNESNKDFYQNKLNRFYEGYESITLITEAEKSLLPYGGLAIWLHYTGIHCQRFDDFSNPFLSEAFLKHWIGVGNNWMEYHDITI